MGRYLLQATRDGAPVRQSGCPGVRGKFVATGVLLLALVVRPEGDIDVAIFRGLVVDRCQHLVQLTAPRNLRPTDLRRTLNTLCRMYQEAVDPGECHVSTSFSPPINLCAGTPLGRHRAPADL